jgi:hypothetical protein
MTATIDTMPATFEVARPHLVPRVYGTSQLSIDFLQLSNVGAESGFPATRPVAGDVVVGVSVAVAEGFVQVSQSTLDGWGVELADALAAAVENSLDRDLAMSQIGTGTFLIRDPEFAAALWERPSLSASLPINGPPVVVAATREVSLVTGADDPQGLLVLAATLEQIMLAGDRVESVTPMTLAKTGWTPVAWAGDAVANGTANMVQHLHSSSLYARQRTPLTDYYRAHGSEMYVVEYQLVKDPQGAALAIAAWTEGVSAALPAVDDLVLIGDGRDVVGVPWAKALEHFSSHLTPLGTTPQRYYARSFPSPDEVQAAL